MAGLEDFFTAQYAAKTPRDYLILPPVDPMTINVAFSKLPARYDVDDGTFKDLFRADFTPKARKLEALSPLTIKILKAKEAAGFDLEALQYDLWLDSTYVLPAVPHGWHVDGVIQFRSFRGDVERNMCRDRMVLSNLFPTARMPTIDMMKYCPKGLDPALFFICMLKAVIGKEIGFAWKKAFAGFGPRSNDDAACEKLVSQLRDAARDLKNTHGMPDIGSPCAVSFNRVTPHAFTCRIVDSSTPGCQLRRCVMFDIAG